MSRRVAGGGSLALLELGGAFFLGAKNNRSLLFTLGGFVTLLLLAQAVASEGGSAGEFCREAQLGLKVARRPAYRSGADSSCSWKSVSLGRRDLGVAFGWSLFQLDRGNRLGLRVLPRHSAIGQWLRRSPTPPPARPAPY